MTDETMSVEAARIAGLRNAIIIGVLAGDATGPLFAAFARAEQAAAVRERTVWMHRHLCDALGWDVPASSHHADWDRAVAAVRRRVEHLAKIVALDYIDPSPMAQHEEPSAYTAYAIAADIARAALADGAAQ